jgi:LPXTG-site transpeptidase (sortase) family protein
MMMQSRNPAGLTLTRRSLLALGPAALGVAAAGILQGRDAIAFAPVEGNARGDMPTSGGMRPGPVGMNPTKVRTKGVTPVAMKIPNAQVDAQVEAQPIQDGVMLDPSGPFVVAWYEDTGKLGQETNVVFAGHLDYYNVGEAVFYHLGALNDGDVIDVIGDDGETFTYGVEWARQYTIDELDASAIQEIVGRTKEEAVTLITCGGDFDYNRGQYLQRYVVRAKRSS